MFCSKCGKPVNENDRFCGNCGEPISPQTSEPAASEEITPEEVTQTNPSSVKKPDLDAIKAQATKILDDTLSFIKKYLPFVCIVGVLLVALIVFLCIASSAKVTAKGALADVADQIADHEILGFAADLLTDGHLRAELPEEENTEEGGNVSTGVTMADLLSGATIDLYTSDKQVSLLLNAADQNLQFHVLADPMSGILAYGDDALGLNLQTAADKFDNSIFHPQSGSRYALPLTDEQVEQLKEYVRSLTDKNLQKDTEKTVKKYGNLIFDLLWKYGKTDAESKSGIRTVTIKLDEESCADFMEALWEKAYDDDDLVELLDTLLPPETYGAELLDGSTAYSSWKEAMQDFDAELDDLLDEIRESDISIRLSVSASTIMHHVEEIKLTFGSAVYMLSFADDTLSFSVKSGSRKIEYALEQLDEGWEFYCKEDGEKVFGAKLLVDEKEDTFRFRVYQNSYGEATDLFYAKGSYTKKSKSLSFTVESVTVDEQQMDLKISVLLEKGADLPDVPEYDDLLAISEEDFVAMLERIMSSINGMGGSEGNTLVDAQF